jgi:hypothetical protein
MKVALLLFLPLTFACSQSEPENTVVVTPVTTYQPSQEDKDNWAKHKGYYQVVYDIQDGGAADYFILNDDGTCTWTYDGRSKNGTYSINSSINELKISIQGNTGVIEDIYSLDENGLWRRPNGYLQKIK